MALWLVRGGKYGEQESVALEQGFACIGWTEIPDLSTARSREAITEMLRQAYPQAKEGKIRNLAGQLYAFAHRIKENDLVAMPLKTRRSVIALGYITGSYEYRTDLGDEVRHVHKVSWVKTDVPRTSFGQDILYSLGAIMTVCKIKRNDAERRVRAILEGKSDATPKAETELNAEEEDGQKDIEELARNQLLNYLQANFRGHDLARLVEAVLQAEDYSTRLSPPGPDGGVDILAGRGLLGLEGPRLCVQVKSSESPADVTVLRTLQGTMANFKADQGLLVSWGGFKSTLEREARTSFFSVRLWDDSALVEAVLRNYEKFSKELQSELPLKRIWVLVPEE